MICLAEVFFDSWQHECCNSGMIRLFAENTDEKVIVAATKNHIKCIRDLLHGISVEYFEIEILPQTFIDNEKDINLYKPIIENIIQTLKLGNSDKIIFLSSRIAAFKAAIELNEQYMIPMFFVQHAELDEVISEKPYGFTKRSILEEAAQNDHNHFITFSPLAKLGLKSVLSQKILDKMIFLHHPVDAWHFGEGDKEVICVYGASGRRKIFKSLLEMLLKCDFDVSGIHYIRDVRCSEDLDYSFLYPEKMTVYQKIGGMSHKEQERIVMNVGWLLITYTSAEYTLSASGILADAISYEIPVLSLDCEYIRFYNGLMPGGIGYVEDNIDDLMKCMGNILKGDCHEQYEIFKENIRKIKRIMMDDNNRIIKQMI